MEERPSLILGTAQFDSAYGVARRGNAIATVCRFLSQAHGLGFTALDTAPGYSDAQEKIGQCSWPGTIHTKVPEGVNSVLSLKESLRELRVGRVGVAYFHDPDALNRGSNYFERFHSLVVPHLAETVGVSVYTPEEFEKALEIDAIDAIQVPMNIVDQRLADNHLNQAKSLGKEVFARSIFLQGALLMQPDSLPDFLSELAPVLSRLRGIASELGMTTRELLIASVRDRSGLSGLIIGAESTEQLKEVKFAYDTPILDDRLREMLRDLRVDNTAILDPRKWS